MQGVGPQLINIIGIARVGTHNDREVKGIHEKEILLHNPYVTYIF